ncbi:MAG: hypothetical protein LBR15_08500 [Methanobrevibacter sp.]|jgi:hypothetical protein|nr:hypothetical protein [Candidatus Methanovirga australis]
MLNMYSKILTSIAILAVICVSTISSCSAYDYPDDPKLDELAEEMHDMKLGDCWGCADYAAGKLTEMGYVGAIVEGPSDYVSNHRAIMLFINGTLVPFESQCANWRGYWQRYWFQCTDYYLKVIYKFNDYPYG